MLKMLYRAIFSVGYCVIGWSIFTRLDAPFHQVVAFAFFFACVSWTWQVIMEKIEPTRAKTSWLIVSVFGLCAGLSMTAMPNHAWVAGLTTVGFSTGGVFCLWLNQEYAANKKAREERCTKNCPHG